MTFGIVHNASCTWSTLGYCNCRTQTKKVSTLHPVERPVNHELVKMLKALVMSAQAGDIVAVGYYAMTPDECVQTQLSASQNRFLELAGVQRMLHRLNLSMDEASQDVSL